MNERIRELAEQAELNATLLYNKEKLEKFAKLLIDECIGCCEQVISDPVTESVDTWLNGGLQCIDEIKHHFGIK